MISDFFGRSVRGRAFASALVLGAGLAARPAAAADPPAPAEPSSPASAEEPATSDKPAPSEAAVREAGQRYETGLSLYAEGEFKLAAIEFERAYALVPNYRVLYNIGQVRIQLGQYARAWGVLDQYLKDGGDEISAERRASVHADLRLLSTRTAKLRIVANVADAEVYIDEGFVGRTPLAYPLLLDAGEHRIQVRKTGYEPQRAAATLAGADDSTVRVELQAIPEKPIAPIVAPPEEKPDPPGRAWILPAWVATGVFAAGAVTTGILGMGAANDLDELKRSPTADRAERDDAKARAGTLLITADVLTAAALVTGGAALYLTLTDPDDDAQNSPRTGRVSLAIGAGSLHAVGQF